MPQYLPTRLLDQAEQRDFMSGLEPYMLDLQKKVHEGIGNLGSIVTGLQSSVTQGVEAARQNLQPQPAAAAMPSLGMGQDLSTPPGYLASSTPEPQPTPAPSVSAGASLAPMPVPPPQASAPSGIPDPAAPAPGPPAAAPAASGFSLPSWEQLTGLAPTAQPSPAPQPAAPTPAEPSPFTMPTWESLTGFPEAARAQPGPAAAGMGAAAPLAGGASPTLPSAPTDVNAYLAFAAQKAGIDPAQVLAVMGKEGPTGWGSVGRFDTGTSYGPLQLHYAGGSNPKQGMGDRFTAATGIDLRTDTSMQAHQAAVDFAMQDLLKDGDWHQWYGADNAFPAASGGKGRFTPVNRVAPTAAAPSASAAQGPPVGSYAAEGLVPNQLSEGAAQGLSSAEALAVCGPAAAVAFARANGRNPTLREAKDLASSMGVWDVSTGMHGPATQVQLLQKMGVPSRLEQGADWGRVASEVQQGRPVIVDTPQHYYVASGYDPASGTFEFGASAGVLRASGGRTRFRPEELPGLGMGAPRATIYLGSGQ